MQTKQEPLAYPLRLNSEHTMAVATATLSDSARVVPIEKLGISSFLFTCFRMTAEMPLPSFPITIMP